MSNPVTASASAAAVPKSPGEVLGEVLERQGRKKLWLADLWGCGPNRVTRVTAGETPMTFEEAAIAARELGVPLETFVPAPPAANPNPEE